MSEINDENLVRFEQGADVRLREKAAGVSAGTIGRVVGWYVNTGEHIVILRSGMPVRVDAAVLERVDTR